jgi:hypothetical protein
MIFPILLDALSGAVFMMWQIHLLWSFSMSGDWPRRRPFRMNGDRAYTSGRIPDDRMGVRGDVHRVVIITLCSRVTGVAEGIRRPLLGDLARPLAGIARDEV